MYILSVNMWFQKLMKQFFFGIDQVVYNAISSIYDLLISIARTSVLSQADILDMADRIYKLLAIFMIFKVTLSLITYIVNPDDFSDKSKGVSKLAMNIVISLGLLILTPYIFNMGYKLQTIILEDNTLATLIFGTKDDQKEENAGDFINTAGDEMAFITMSAFFTPNTSITQLQECIELKGTNGKFNPDCSGLKEDYSEDTSITQSMAALTKGNDNFTLPTLQNYVVGVDNENLGLMFRAEMAVATDDKNENFIIDYKYIFSTVVGVVIVLLLITFCMDVALRSIKLAFLQLIAPIPILSYVDPKSGKDGMFKKWYQLCFKTYLSLFIRLLALYFAVYIIGKVADMQLVDIIDGSQQTHAFIYIFVIIGALMFAKQLPKILEGLGIKLDGDGKFFLNPLKKFEEQAAGGKRMTGAAGGMVAGAVGGHGFFGRMGSALTGSLRGAAANKGYAGGLARQAEVNRKLREARINGAGFWGSRAAVLSSRYGLDDADLERDATRLRVDKRSVELRRREVDQATKGLEVSKKGVENSITPKQTVIQKQRDITKSIGDMESFSTSLIETGKAGRFSAKYKDLKSSLEYLSSATPGQKADRDITNADGVTIVRAGDEITSEHALKLQGEAERYSKKVGRKAVMDELLTGDTVEVGAPDIAEFESKRAVYERSVDSLNEYLDEYNATASEDSRIEHVSKEETFGNIHDQSGTVARAADALDLSISEQRDEIAGYDRQIKDIQATTTVQISGESQPLTIEEAERIIKEREQVLKDTRDQRKLNRDTARDRRIGNGS